MSVPALPPSTATRRATSFVSLVALLCVCVLVSGLVPAAAQTDEDALREQLEQVEAERAALSDSLADATGRVDDLTARLAQVRDRSRRLRQELEGLRAEGAKAQRLMDARVRDIYKGKRVNDVMAFATGTTLSEMTARTHYLTAMTREQRGRWETAAALVRTTAARQAELRTVDGRLDELVAEAAQAQADLDARFAAAADASEDLQTEIARAEAEARRLAAEAAAKRRAAEQAAREAQAEDAERQLAEAEAAERRAAAASRSADRARAEAEVAPPQPDPARASGGSSSGSSGGTSSSGTACPQDNPRSFTDTWGAPRSGGRTHQGTDIFGARGGRVFAIVSGTVEWTTTGASSGLFLSLRGNDGNTYWYMHLQDFVASAGQSVRAGDLIAHNGDTGNAQGTTPHIHFEYHPGGGGAVNPYPMLKSVCG